MGTLPGGSESAGSTGIVFKQIAALGEAESYGFDMGMGIKIHHGRGCQGMNIHSYQLLGGSPGHQVFECFLPS
jgi:hypothetical protein